MLQVPSGSSPALDDTALRLLHHLSAQQQHRQADPFSAGLTAGPASPQRLTRSLSCGELCPSPSKAVQKRGEEQEQGQADRAAADGREHSALWREGKNKALMDRISSVSAVGYGQTLDILQVRLQCRARD